MPATVNKDTADKFTHMTDAEPERDGLDYGPDDDYIEIVTSVPADQAQGQDQGDTLDENYSSQGKSADDKMDMGGENYSQDIVQRTREPEPDKPAEKDDTAGDGKPKDQSPAQKRISEIIKDRNKAREEAAYYRGIAEGKSGADSDAAADPKDVPAKAEKPKLEDFENYEDFSEAMADYKIAERDQKSAVEARANEQAKTQQLLKAKLDEGFKVHEDFEAVAFGDHVPFNDAMIEVLADCDNAAEIAYSLGKNPEEAKRISQMSSTGIAREFGKLDAKFSGSAAAVSQPPKKVSSAAAPINPVNTGSADVVRKSPEDMTMAEFIKWRTKGGKRKV